FWDPSSAVTPPPKSLPADFLAYVEGTIDWDEFSRRRAPTPPRDTSSATPVSLPVPDDFLSRVKLAIRILKGTSCEQEANLADVPVLAPSGSPGRRVFRATWTAMVLATFANVLIWLFADQAKVALAVVWGVVSNIGFSAVLPSPETIPLLIHSGGWIVSPLMLAVVAWARFNTPVTNRLGTAFALFYSGFFFYYAMIVALWLVLIIVVRQGAVAFDKVFLFLGAANPMAQNEFDTYAPLMAAFVLVVALDFPWMLKLDRVAREFCV